MKTVANIEGGRPQFIKAGPVSKALAKASLEEILVHTGQHYDPLLSQEIMDDVGLRKPDLNLGVGSAGHAAQTAEILRGVESLLMDRQPDLVVTYGDTNSTSPPPWPPPSSASRPLTSRRVSAHTTETCQKR